MKVGGERIVCVTFDLDDTLWACHPVIMKAEKIFYQWLECHYPQISGAFTLKELFEDRRHFFGKFPEAAHDLSGLRRRWLGGLADDFGCPWDPFVEEGFEVFLAARNDVVLFDGVHDTLRHVSEQFICGSITNGNADVARIGIGQFFDFNITASDAGAAKPDPAIFQAAADAAGVPPGQMLHVGDDPERDIRGAASAGLKTLWINPDEISWEGAGRPDMEVRSVTELSGLLTC